MSEQQTAAPETTGPARGRSFLEAGAPSPPCWRCGAPVDGSFRCAGCGAVQRLPDETDHFGLFGFACRLTLDQEALQRRYYALSRLFHPDYYQRKSPEEQAISLENTARLNRAYRTLKDPDARLVYLIGLVEGDASLPAEAPADLFDEIFEAQETLEAVRENGKGAEKAPLHQDLAAILARMTAYRKAGEAALSSLSAEWDRLEEARNGRSFTEAQRRCLREMKKILSHRAYLDRIIREIRSVLNPNR